MNFSEDEDSSSLIAKRKKPIPLSSSEDSDDAVDDDDTSCTSDDSFSSVDSVPNNVTSEWTSITERRIRMYEYAEEDSDVDTNDPPALYSLFLTDNILQLIVEETNRYAGQCQSFNNNETSRKHQKAWANVTFEEMKRFFGIVLIMGITQVPEIRFYWSDNTMYTKGVMKRDRFLDILKFLHFSDNTTADQENRLNKIQNIINKISEGFKCVVIAGKDIVIDESMVPWRGRLRFRQYLPGKSHKYGIKLYKLCFPGGYTNNFEIYAGKNGTAIRRGHSHDVVMRLTRDLLNEGRTIPIFVVR